MVRKATSAEATSLSSASFNLPGSVFLDCGQGTKWFRGWESLAFSKTFSTPWGTTIKSSFSILIQETGGFVGFCQPAGWFFFQNTNSSLVATPSSFHSLTTTMTTRNWGREVRSWRTEKPESSFRELLKGRENVHSWVTPSDTSRARTPEWKQEKHSSLINVTRNLSSLILEGSYFDLSTYVKFVAFWKIKSYFEFSSGKGTPYSLQCLRPQGVFLIWSPLWAFFFFSTSVYSEPCPGSGLETVLSQGLLDELIDGWNICRTEYSAGKEAKMRVRGGMVLGSSIWEPDGNICSGTLRDLP